MSRRIRHCVECPKCHIRYLIGGSPYRNGAYLVSAPVGSEEIHTLHCSCGRLATFARNSEVKTCVVSPQAHGRGYGPPDEIVSVSKEETNAG